MNKSAFLLLMSMVASGMSQAAEKIAEKATTLKLEHAWVREVPPTAENSAGYISIVNTGAADHLLSVESPAAKITEMHEMKMENGVMEMNHLPCVDIPAGKTLNFEPGGMHIMLLNLKQPLKAGDQVPMTFEFEKAGKITINATVEKKN